MRNLKSALLSTLLLLAAVTMAGAQTTKIAEAPKSIQTLSARIQGANPELVLEILGNQLGPPSRVAGSGLSMPEWDLPDGVLTFHPLSGPYFFNSRTKRYFRLVQTKNPVAANLLGTYEMSTLPNSSRVSFYLGYLEFGPNSTYQFTDSGQHHDQRSAQKENFFMLYPTGTVEVHYAVSVTPSTLLESVQKGTVVAKLVFNSANQQGQSTFSITSSELGRRLDFSAEKPMSFRLNKPWESYWN